MTSARVQGVALAAAALLLAAVAGVAVTKRLEKTSGDASIYWVYAQSMWSDGLFHYGAEGPKGGASSPLWAFLLSLLHPVVGEHFVGYKLLGVVLLCLATAATFRLALSTGLSPPAAGLAGALVLALVPLQDVSAVAYETPLFVFALVTAVATTASRLEDEVGTPARPRRLATWSLALAALSLARPEGALFFVLLLAWAAAFGGRRLLRDRGAWIAVILAAIPWVAFHLWMYAATGDLVPSSAAGRYLRQAAGELPPVPWNVVVNQCTGARAIFFWQDVVVLRWIWSALAVIGALVLLRRSPARASGLVLVPVTFLLVLLWKNPGFLVFRYALPAVPFAVVLAVCGAAFLLSLGRRQAAGRGAIARAAVNALALVAVTIAVSQSARTLWRTTRAVVPESPFDVLDLAAAELANEHMSAGDRALVYEIQSQYYLDCQAVSADGIVGGEILPYLRTGRISAFFDEQRITHVLYSEAFRTRPIYRGTLLARLGELDASWPPGAAQAVDGVKLTKLQDVRRSGEWSIAHWTSLYRVDGYRADASNPGNAPAYAP